MQTFKSYISEYTENRLKLDIEKLTRMFENKFQPNQKLITTVLDQIYESGEDDADIDFVLRMEIDRFNIVVETACALPENQTPKEQLENIICWLANNGKNPENGLNATSKRRYTEIQHKLET